MDYHSSVRVLLSQNILTNLKPSDIILLDENVRVKRSGDQMPVVFLPEESETQCVAQNRMSSFGFLAFVVQSINAVVNVANNINDNNNNRNNNNNDNNNNQVCHSDTNLYNIGSRGKYTVLGISNPASPLTLFYVPFCLKFRTLESIIISISDQLILTTIGVGLLLPVTTWIKVFFHYLVLH